MNFFFNSFISHVIALISSWRFLRPLCWCCVSLEECVCVPVTKSLLTYPSSLFLPLPPVVSAQCGVPATRWRLLLTLIKTAGAKGPTSVLQSCGLHSMDIDKLYCRGSLQRSGSICVYVCALGRCNPCVKLMRTPFTVVFNA